MKDNINHEEEWFIVEDLEKLVEATRTLVFSNFGKTNKEETDELTYVLSDLASEEIEELNEVLTQTECILISKSHIKEQRHKKTKKIRYIMSNGQFMEMIESFNSRMISNLLHNLVKKGSLDTAYDEKSNDFIFWIKDNDKE